MLLFNLEMWLLISHRQANLLFIHWELIVKVKKLHNCVHVCVISYALVMPGVVLNVDVHMPPTQCKIYWLCPLHSQLFSQLQKMYRLCESIFHCCLHSCTHGLECYIHSIYIVRKLMSKAVTLNKTHI